MGEGIKGRGEDGSGGDFASKYRTASDAAAMSGSEEISEPTACCIQMGPISISF
jgi:hypothetical protein